MFSATQFCYFRFLANFSLFSQFSILIPVIGARRRSPHFQRTISLVSWPILIKFHVNQGGGRGIRLFWLIRLEL